MSASSSSRAPAAGRSSPAPTSPSSAPGAPPHRRPRRLRPRSGANWRVWRHVTKPVIAKIDGYCIGGGLLMALQADIRICSEPSTFAVPAARLGLGLRLRRRAPADAPRQPGDRRRDPVLGPPLLVGRSAEHRARQPRRPDRPSWRTAVVALAGQIARNAPLTVAACKAAIRLAAEGGPTPTPATSMRWPRRASASQDYLEGQAAFLAKREPDVPRRLSVGAVLDDLLVLDLTIARAGPTAVRYLADWGATVLRIEQRRRRAERSSATTTARTTSTSTAPSS